MTAKKTAVKKAEVNVPQMPTLYELFETDIEAGEGGKWLELIPGISFKLRRFTSTASLNSRRRLLAGLASRVTSDGDIDSKLETELMIEQMAEAIIVDWKGVADRDGNELACTYENRKRVLTDLPDVRALLSDHAANIDNYRREQLDAIEKN